MTGETTERDAGEQRDASAHDAPASEAPPREKRMHSLPLRPVVFSFGVLFVALGAAGIFLPLLPTTPLLLLAAACFARSSPRAHRALLANRFLGPVVAQWERERSVPPRAKAAAIAGVIGAFGLSLALLRDRFTTMVLVPLCIALVVFLWRLPASRALPGGGAPGRDNGDGAR